MRIKTLQLTGHSANQSIHGTVWHSPRCFEPAGRQLSAQTFGVSAIHFFAVTDLHNVDEKPGVVDCVYNSVAALANAVLVTLAGEFFASARPRFRC